MNQQQAEEKAIKDAETEQIVQLSILMPTIPERKERFKRLYESVMRQIIACRMVHPTLGMVEIVKDDSKKFTDGGLTIGAKRQTLITEANGEYLCFLDDDDDVSPDYVETLLRLCYSGRDVCTFNNISKMDNYWCVVRMSLTHMGNEQARPGIINRRPWHICPVKTEIARRAKFPESNYGEDWVWFEQVVRMCHTEERTEAIIHSYNHSLKVSQADNLTTAI